MGCPRPNVPRSDPYDLGELVKDLRDRLYTLFHDAPTRGLTLVSGYRDPGRQWDLRAQRVGTANACNPAVRAVPATAVPAQWNGSAWVGGSDHQRRTAADIGGRELQWAINNRARYGLGLTVLSENWHFQAHGIDKRTRRPIPAPTVRILEYPGPSYDARPPKPARPGVWRPFGQGTTDRKIAAAGGLANQVAEVQIILTQLAARWDAPDLRPGKIDGIFGTGTGRAISAFKARIIGLQRATGGKVWPNTDTNVGPATIDMLRFWNASS